MDWKKTTDFLYKKINPKEGRICSMVNDSYNIGIQFSNFWIEFDTGGFLYVDPFYEEIKSEYMDIDLVTVADQYNIGEIQEFENREFSNSENQFNGCFSGSIDIIPRLLKFGEIKSNKIGFEMEYSLTNSDSYGMMDGTKEEHLQHSGKLNIDLLICDLSLIEQKDNGLEGLLKKLNPNIYDLKSIECTRQRTEDIQRNEYKIKYKNIKGAKVKKPWWKLY
jgi:hypothetical protein